MVSLGPSLYHLRGIILKGHGERACWQSRGLAPAYPQLYSPFFIFLFIIYTYVFLLNDYYSISNKELSSIILFPFI